jgi:aminoglycoside phosphotransferase (APT) family kinase protein
VTALQTAPAAALPPVTDDRLARFLARHLARDLANDGANDGAPNSHVAVSDVMVSGIQRMEVGWSHETVLFDAAWRADGEPVSRGFVLRRDPGNSLLRHLSDLRVQFDVLTGLRHTGVPAPAGYWFEAADEDLGGPLLVMEKVPGVCPSPWNRRGREFYEAAAARGVLPGSFTRALAAVHRADWQAAGLDLLGVPAAGTNEFALREIARWRGLLDTVEVEPEPVVADLLHWLEANAPVTEHVTLVHGSYRTGNLLVHDDEISAVLDWETPAIGDPMYDVAYVLSDLNRGGSGLLSCLVEPDQFAREYTALTGYPIDRAACRYYDVLYAMRSAVFWMSASGLFRSGRNRDLRLARTTYSLPVVLDQAARQLGY